MAFYHEAVNPQRGTNISEESMASIFGIKIFQTPWMEA
jgi:hypothetical protein